MGDLTQDDAQHKLQDLSGIVLQPGENPYDAFIKACNNDHKEIQTLYATHRVTRNAQQKEKFISPDFTELSIDQHLRKLEDPRIQPRFKDERHCITIWARPPSHIIRLVTHLQQLLQKQAPSLWLMPSYRLHLTTLEVAFSKTAEEIAELVATLRPALPSIVNHTHTHRSRLVKPMISYDLSAFALSFLPAAGEPSTSPPPWAPDSVASEDIVQGVELTYHHVRREVFDKVKEAGVLAGSRYQVPSAHITLGRYLTHNDHDTPEKRQAWISTIDEINDWLEREVWDNPDGEFIGEWVVGHEKGLDSRCGTVWYGEGRTIMMGEGS